MIKKNILVIGALILTATSAFSQVKVGNQIEVAIVDQTPFLDVSNYNTFDGDRGRGLYFPRTDLTTFKFITDKLEGIDTFLTAFDGMVVYNTASGRTGSDAQTQGLQVDVEPGFYYFSNPDSKNQGGRSVAEGKWIRIGGSSNGAVDYKVGDDAKPTGEFFWVDEEEANKKPVMRKTIEVVFNDATYTEVTGMVPKTAVFIKTQLVDKDTRRLLLASAEFKPGGSGDREFSVDPSKDFFVAKYGEMSTTLNGTYTMILEYYVP